MTRLALFPDDSYVIGGSSTWSGGDHATWINSFDSSDVMRWSATYAGDDDATVAAVTGFDVLPRKGLLVTADPGATSDRDAWLFRIDEEGMPVWFKSFRGPDDDTLSGVVKMDTGLLAFGRTQSVNDLPSPQYDLWVVRTSVDGMANFTAASGMDTVNDEVSWKRTSHVTRPLSPVNRPGALTTTIATLGVVPANAINELLTQ